MLRKIFEEYYSPLCNYVNDYLEDVSSSRSIVQNAFIQLSEEKEPLHSQDIKKILFHSVQKALFNEINNEDTSRYPTELLTLVQSSSVEDFDLYMIKSEALKAFQNIDSISQRAFLLFKEEKKTFNEVATELELPPKTVSDKIGQTFMVLRKELLNNPKFFN